MATAQGSSEDKSKLPAESQLLPSQLPDPETPGFKYRLIDYKGTFMFADWASMMPEVESFPSKSDDVFLNSFPKSGTTWMETLITLIRRNGDKAAIANNGFFGPDAWRFPHLEARYTNLNNAMIKGNIECIGQAKNLKSPRHIKTHLPYNLLPADIETVRPKIIYIHRNVKDVMVSLYYHYLHAPEKNHTTLTNFHDFVLEFIADKVGCAPYFQHVNSYWKRRDQSNVLLVAYEDLKKDPSGQIRKMASFMGTALSEEEIESVRVNSTVDAMRDAQVSARPDKDPKDHQFIRSGKSGAWKTHFTPELNEKVDPWIRKNIAELEFNQNWAADALG